MLKTVLTTEAKTQLSALIDWATEHRDQVIVENHGRSQVGNSSYSGYPLMSSTKSRQAFAARHVNSELVRGSKRMRHQLPVAVHVFLVRDGKILLLRRFNTGYEDGSYSVIAGHLDGNEQVRDAAIREAKEEAGIDLEFDALRVIGVMHRRTLGDESPERIDFFLVATEWLGEVNNQEPHKCDELAWFDWGSLPTTVIPYVREAISHGVESMWFASFGWDSSSSL